MSYKISVKYIIFLKMSVTSMEKKESQYNNKLKSATKPITNNMSSSKQINLHWTLWILSIVKWCFLQQSSVIICGNRTKGQNQDCFMISNNNTPSQLQLLYNLLQQTTIWTLFNKSFSFLAISLRCVKFDIQPFWYIEEGNKTNYLTEKRASIEQCVRQSAIHKVT